LRFFDEGEAESVYTYAKTGWAVLSEPGGVAYQLYDQTMAGLLNEDYTTYAEPVEAPTLAELAVKLGIEPRILEHTVEEFNAAVQDDVPLDRTRRDGRSTLGVTPPKSNWATRIATPPFRAYAVTAGITFTFGGLKVDSVARVISNMGVPITGLFASGDIVGLFFHNYPSCTGQTRNIVFSRLAGAGAAQVASG
jgi:tricarballylate dehydrogenase